MMMAMSKVTAVVMLLSALVCRLDCICVDCHLPPNATEKEVERLVILDFKVRLMERLGLKTEPKSVVSLPVPIVKAISTPGQLAGDQPKQTNEEGNKITDIVLGPTSGYSLGNNAYLCKFQVSSKFKGTYEVIGVKLWLHVNKSSRRHWFQVYDKTRMGRRLLLNDSINSFASEWKEFKLTPNKEWYKTPWKILNLVIVGINDDQNKQILSTDDKKPRLQLLTRPVKQRIYKRSNTQTNDCSNNGRCCKHRMTLNLTRHIKWLIVPKTIQALVCRGDCPFLYRTRWAWTLLAQLQQSRKPCCVPTKLRPISVIHGDDKGAIIQTEVSDMLVVSCGCS